MNENDMQMACAKWLCEQKSAFMYFQVWQAAVEWADKTYKERHMTLVFDAPADYLDGELEIRKTERDLIERALEATGGFRGQAAAKLGISERTLYRKMKEYGL